MRHYIQKQQLLLALRQGADAFAIQHAASHWFRQGLTPVLERIFDELSVEDEVIRLDLCVIDLGVIGEAALREGIVDEALYRRLKEEIRLAIDRERALRRGAGMGIAENVLERWWYYMVHGRLPWNADGLKEEDYRQVLEQFSVDFAQITRLRKALMEDMVLLTRVVAQHSGWFLEKLVTVLVSSRQEGLGEAVSQAVKAHQLLEQVYQQWIYGIAEGPAPAALKEREVWESLSGWSERMAVFRQGPAYEQKAILWQRLLVQAAGRRDEFVRKGGVRMLLRDVTDSLPLMEIILADRAFRDGDGPFVQAIRTATAGRKSTMEKRETKDEDIRRGKGLTEGGGEEDLHRPATGMDEDAGAAKEGRGGEAEGLRESGAGSQETTKENVRHGAGMTEIGSDEDARRPVMGTQDTGPAMGTREDSGIAKEIRGGEAEERRESGAERQEPAKEDVGHEAGMAKRGVEEGTGIGTREDAGILKASRGSEAGRPEKKEEDHAALKAPEGPRVPAEQRARQDDARFKREEVSEEGMYIPNAGLILVHPFLGTLFRRLGLWDGAGFASLAARQRAIFLLHFLVTGEKSAPEYLLVFPKMLCGYALEMPVPGEMELTDEECDEALVLLENVVLRWEKLGNTSLEGLREGFLQRNGKLYDKGGRLCLLVESSGIDVLLDFLPWNISLVKLPWLKDILYVEWR